MLAWGEYAVVVVLIKFTRTFNFTYIREYEELGVDYMIGGINSYVIPTSNLQESLVTLQYGKRFGKSQNGVPLMLSTIEYTGSL